MIQKNSVLEILHKYSFDSFYNEPYLYMSENQIGLMYSFIHPSYGYLKRIRFLNTLEEIEDFVYSLWWYKKNNKLYSVTLELDDYEIISPKPIFFAHNKEITVAEMKVMDGKTVDHSIQEKKQNRFQRLIRTARILVTIIEEKINVQNATYKNVVDMMREYNKQDNEYLQLYNRYQKTSLPFHEIKEVIYEEENTQEEIKSLKEVINQLNRNYEKEKELIDFIDSLWKTLKSMEMESGHLQNKYLLIKLPIDIEDVKKRKTYLETVLNKRYGLFSKKEDIHVGLKNLEEASDIHKIVKMDDYIQNEIKRIEEKYAIIEDMDYTTLGDYLNEFDNLGIVCPEESETPYVAEIVFTPQEIVDQFHTVFETLNPLQKCALNIYHSFMKSLCDEVLNFQLEHHREMNYQDLSKYLVDFCNRCYEVLNKADNLIVRLKYFKELQINSPQDFFKSLVTLLDQLKTIHEFVLPCKVKLFGKNILQPKLGAYYHGSMNVLNAPMQNSMQNDLYDILTLPRGTMVLYYPYFFQLSEDLDDYHTIKVIENRMDLDFNLQNITVNFQNSDIITVQRFDTEEMIDEDRIKIVHKMVPVKANRYRIII